MGIRISGGRYWPTHRRRARPTGPAPRAHAARRASRKPLTQRQREIYDYVVASIRERGYAPSLREIAERCSFASLSTVHEHLSTLEEKGWIKRGFNEARAISIVDPAA